MRKLTAILATLTALSGCATTPLASYEPTDGQSVVYDQGVGAITAQTSDGTVTMTMYPTFRYQSPNDIPTFTLMVHNNTSRDIDFNPESMTAGLDNRQCHIYSLQERVSEIHKAAVRKKVALAIVGGLAAGAAAYGASHTTTNYTSVGYVGGRSFYSSGVIQTYDPASGIFAGAAVGAATGVGIHQIAKEAGYQEEAAQGIFQHSTVHPGSTVVGQVELKTGSAGFTLVHVGVPIDGDLGQFKFSRKVTL